MKIDKCRRYSDLFCSVRQKVYASSDRQQTPSLGMNGPTLSAAPGSTMGISDSETLENMTSFPFMLPESQMWDGYTNQLTTFFDDGLLDGDDVLAAWYGSIMDESQPERSQSLV